VLEQIYKEKYNEDSEKFSQYISEICIANEVDFNEDLSYLQEELNSKEANEDCGYSHEEIWSYLEKKYAN
jgi:hypothetical protein